MDIVYKEGEGGREGSRGVEHTCRRNEVVVVGVKFCLLLQTLKTKGKRFKYILLIDI